MSPHSNRALRSLTYSHFSPTHFSTTMYERWRWLHCLITCSFKHNNERRKHLSQERRRRWIPVDPPPPRSQMFSQCFYLSLGIQNINNFQRGDLPSKVEGGNKVILAGLISSPPHAIWEAPLNSIFIVWSLFILKFVQKAHLPSFYYMHAWLFH